MEVLQKQKERIEALGFNWVWKYEGDKYFFYYVALKKDIEFKSKEKDYFVIRFGYKDDEVFTVSSYLTTSPIYEGKDDIKVLQKLEGYDELEFETMMDIALDEVVESPQNAQI